MHSGFSKHLTFGKSNKENNIMPGRDFTTVHDYSNQFLMNQNESGEFSKDLPAGERNKMSDHDSGAPNDGFLQNTLKTLFFLV